MATKIVAQRDKSALVAGMLWQPLTAGPKKRGSEIREILAGSDANKIALITSHSNSMIGLYTAEDELDDGDGKRKYPSKLYSIALAFASMVRDSNAVLAYNIPDTALAVFVVVEGGRPLLDDVKAIEDVQNLAKSYASGNNGFVYTLYTNDLGSFAAGEDITEDDLWKYAGKIALLEGKPADVRSLLVLLVAILVLGGCAYGYHVYDKAQKRKKMLAEQQANNPLIKYEAELAAKINALGLDAAAIVEVMRSVGSHPLRQVGWGLKQIRCTADTGQCLSKWTRQGGTTNELIAARKPFGEEIQGDSTIEESNFLLKTTLTRTGMSSRDVLPPAAQAIIDATPIYQVLANAGVNLLVPPDGYKLWPETPGATIGTIPENIAIRMRPVEFSTAMPLAIQTVSALPKNFWWTEVHITAEDASKDALTAMSVTLKGNSYVR